MAEENINNSKNKLLILAIVMSLFVCEDIFVFGTITTAGFIIARQIIQVLIFAYLLSVAIIHHITIKKKKFILFIALSGLVLLSAFLNNDIRNGYFFLIMIFFICMVLSEIVSMDYVLDVLFEIMVVLCAISLVLYIIYEISPALIRRLPLFYNTAGTPFYTGFVANVPNTYDSFHRNYGAFREPGVFQAYIIMALMHAFDETKKEKYWKIIVLILALITTFSTTGYLSLFMIVFAIIFSKKTEKGFWSSNVLKYSTLVVFFLLIAYMYFGTSLLYNGGYGSVFGKLAGFTSSTSRSTGARVASITANIHMFLEHPIAGAGITYVDTMYSTVCQQLYGSAYVDNTNTLFIQLARFGIVYFGIIVYGYYKYIKNKYNAIGNVSMLFFLGAFFILFIGQALPYSILFTLPLFCSNNIE